MQPHNLDRFGRQVDVFKHLFNRWIKHAGLTYNTYAVLYSLAVSESGFCTQKEIADEWLIAKQTVFNICKDFHEKGWIEFGGSSDDKRERLMRLTESGLEQAQPVMRLWHDLDKNIFEAFGTERAAAMFALTDEFARVFEAEINRQVKKRAKPSEIGLN